MQTVDSADGTGIAYEEHGEGPPLILLHGGSAPQYWRPVVPRLAESFTVLVPHRRGHGASGDSETYSLDREVADVRAVVDAAEGTPTLFGHSFGGLLALEAARCARLAGVVAYEPGVLVGEYREQADLAARMQALLEAGQRREAMREYVREVVVGGEVEDFDAWLEAWEPWPGIVDLAENTVRMNRAIEGYRLPETLDVEAPVLLLTGTEGPPHLREGVRAVHDALPDSRLVEFEGVSHSGPVEAPDRTTEELRVFVEGTALPASTG